MPKSHEPHRVDRFIEPYVREMALWPVTFALLAHVVLAVAISWIEVRRSVAGFAVLALLVMGIASVASWGADWRRGRLGISSGIWLVMWPLGLACGVWADQWELY